MDQASVLFVMYTKSEPLKRWLGVRAATIRVLAGAHASTGAVGGPGRPLDISKPLAHAYVTGVVSEFQGFTRDLHDLATERLIAAAGVPTRFTALLIDGLVAGRGIDRGNATLTTIKSDFGRLGLSPFDLSVHDRRWASGDSAEFGNLLTLRNALAHGNERELLLLRSRGVVDTVSWSRRRLPVLNRVARAMDHLVWNHLKATFGADPWR